VTLLELLIVLGLTGMITAALTTAYVAGADYETRIRVSREEAARRRAFEDRITDLLRHAYISNDSTDTTTYFIGGAVDGTLGGGTSLGGSIAESVTFTTVGQRISAAVASSQDDFETLNRDRGPQGGVAEVSVGLTPVGDPGNQEGLFLREQRPSDGDPTQGGFESVLSDQVDRVEFEFFDGLQWQPTWDTQTQTTKRLPAAVRVTYQFLGDEEDRVLVVQIPGSDVTPQNPVTEAGS